MSKSIGINSEKIYTIDNHIYATLSGLTADGNYLLDLCRNYAHNEWYIY